MEYGKLLKVLVAISLTALVTQSCALRPRFNDLVPKEQPLKVLRLRVVNAETGQPVPGASVEMGEAKFRSAGVTDANGEVSLPVHKKNRDDNSVIVVTMAAGMPRYELMPLDVAPPSAGQPPAIEEIPGSGPPPAAAGKKSLEFAPHNAVNALVVLYRNTAGMMGSGAMLGATVKVDGQAVGDLPHDTYLVVELAPGRHTVTAQSAAGESNWLVNVAAGAVEYAQLQPMPFRLQAKPAAEALSEMRADAESLSQSARANLGAPASP